jgi:hypothetical protein
MRDRSTPALREVGAEDIHNLREDSLDRFYRASREREDAAMTLLQDLAASVELCRSRAAAFSDALGDEGSDARLKVAAQRMVALLRQTAQEAESSARLVGG